MTYTISSKDVQNLGFSSTGKEMIYEHTVVTVDFKYSFEITKHWINQWTVIFKRNGKADVRQIMGKTFFSAEEVVNHYTKLQSIKEEVLEAIK